MTVAAVSLKSIESGNDIFSTSSLYQNDWMQNLRANDLVLIAYSRNENGSNNYTMSGLIDTIHRTRKIETNGKVSHTITIQGRDFGKILVNSSVTLISTADVENYISGPGLEANISVENTQLYKMISLPDFAERGDLIAKVTQGKSVKQAVSEILKWYWGVFANLKWITPFGTLTMKDAVDWDTRSIDDPSLVQGMEIAQSGGSLASLIQQFAEKPFYESFLDSDFKNAGKAFLTVRPTPFSKIEQGTLWDELDDYHLIDDFDIIMEETSSSDSDTYSAFKIAPVLFYMGESDIPLVFPMKVFKELYDRYGFKLMDIKSRLLTYEKEKFVQKLESMKLQFNVSKKRDMIASWYYPNDIFQSGSLIISGYDKIRAGEYLMRKISDEDVMVYYVESVQQSWAFRQKRTTTLGVTRGLLRENYKFFFPELDWSSPVFRPERKSQ